MANSERTVNRIKRVRPRVGIEAVEGSTIYLELYEKNP